MPQQFTPKTAKPILITFLFFSLQCYILPNQPINEKTLLHMFQVPVETIEKASGLVLFDQVPRNRIRQIQPKIPLSS